MARHAAPGGPGAYLGGVALTLLRPIGYALLAAALGIVATILQSIAAETTRLRNDISNLGPGINTTLNDLRGTVARIPTTTTAPQVTVQAPAAAPGYTAPRISITTAPGAPGPTGARGAPAPTIPGASTPPPATPPAAPQPCLLGLALLCPR